MGWHGAAPSPRPGWAEERGREVSNTEAEEGVLRASVISGRSYIRDSITRRQARASPPRYGFLSALPGIEQASREGKASIAAVCRSRAWHRFSSRGPPLLQCLSKQGFVTSGQIDRNASRRRTRASRSRNDALRWAKRKGRNNLTTERRGRFLA